jgi:hypothetical protein
VGIKEQVALVFLVAPSFLVGLILWLQARANDRRAEDRHQAVLRTFGHEGREVAMAGPDSRRGAGVEQEEVIPFVADPVGLSDETLDAIAAELCPCGPRPAGEVALVLGWRGAPSAELPGAVHVHLVEAETTVLYRDDSRGERNLLEGCAAVALLQRRIRPTAVAVAAVVRRLTRPVSVRTAM